MRKMKDSGIEWIGEIPEDWEVCKLKPFLQWKSVKGFGNETVLSLYRDFGILPKESRDDNHNVTSLDTDSYKLVEIGDFVINKMKAWQGSMAISNYRGIVSPAYHVCSIKNSKIYKPYFHYLMRNKSYLPEYERLSSGLRIGQWDLSFEDFCQIKFIIPSFIEQQQIADFLDEKVSQIDSTISKTRESIEEYKKLKQSIITEVVTGKVKIENGKVKESEMLDVKGNKLPNDWKWMKLKYLVTENLQYGANEAGVDFSRDLPRYIRITDIDSNGKLKNENKLSLTEEVARNFILDEGDILFARSGASVGKTFIYKSEYARAGFAGYLIRAKLNKSIINPQFFFYFTNSSFYEIWKNGIFIQSTIQNIGADKYSELQVPVPPLTSQLSLITFLDKKCSEIDSLIAKKEQLVVELEAYKKSLIYEVVTGKREV